MDKYIAGFGEVMLRLAPRDRRRLAQALPGELDATFGGGEANVCASIALLGGNSRYLSALPDNPVARALLTQLRGLGVDVSRVRLTKSGRLGVYYVEHGAAQRGSNVVYDREHSVIAESSPEDYDFSTMLESCGHLHLTGITPALSEKAYRSTLEIARKASELGIHISIDLNFRGKLWNWEPGTDRKALAARCMNEIVRYADLIIGNEEDAANVFGIAAAGTEIERGKLNVANYVDVARQLAAKFPKAKLIAITLRESVSADHNRWGGMLYERGTGQAHFAPLNVAGEYTPYDIADIVDRFGGGDSFGAGLITALTENNWSDAEHAIRFAVAASCLKHSVFGDFNYIVRNEVEALMTGGGSGRVKR